MDIEQMDYAYLGGPMRGIPYFNFPAFDAAAAILRRDYWNIHSPAEKDRDVLDVARCPEGSDAELEEQGFSLAGALAWDFARIAESDCVIFLPGWEKSTGCSWEATVAYALGKPVFQYPDLTPVELPAVVTDPTRCVHPDVLAAKRLLRPDLFGPTPQDEAILVPKVRRDSYADAHVACGDCEIRVTDPTSGAEKGSKLARFDLLPWDVIHELAEHYGRGARKYADRNWEGGYAYSLSIAALGRHLAAWLSGEDTDPETGSSHLIAVAWHAMALRWFQLHGRGTDDRSGKAA